MKNELIRFWLTHHYLKKIAKRYPQFFLSLIGDVTDNFKQERIMKERYIEKKKFEAIAIDMNVDTRYIFRLHRQVIDKLIEI